MSLSALCWCFTLGNCRSPPDRCPRWETCSSHEIYDVVVIGAGILGLATARQLLIDHPAIRLAVIDKEPVIAAHQTGHNSGVLHAGLYYVTGSLKAQLCRTGKTMLEGYVSERGIPVDYCGKLVIATDVAQLAGLMSSTAGVRPTACRTWSSWGPPGYGTSNPTLLARAALVAVDRHRRLQGGGRRDGRRRPGIRGHHPTRRRGHRHRAAYGTPRDQGPFGSLATRNVIACAGLHADRALGR